MNAQHAAAADSPAAFAAQLDSHRHYLLRAARMKLRDPPDAEDAVPDAGCASWNRPA